MADWIIVLRGQERAHGKRACTLAELAHLSGATNLPSLRVELSRLVARRVLERYGAGCYGLRGAATVDDVLPVIDPTAYITGLAVLFEQGFVTQAPTTITCFTRQRHRRAVSAIAGVPVRFFTAGGSVYSHPGTGRAAAPQALYDFVYLVRRHGADTRGLVSWRDRDRLRELVLAGNAAPRYPASVRAEVERLLAPPRGADTAQHP